VIYIKNNCDTKLWRYNIKCIVKNISVTIKEMRTSLVIMTAIWVILGILNYMGIKSKYISILNFLTVSLNGFQGNGIIGVFGGITAKLWLVMMMHQTISGIKQIFEKKKYSTDIKENKRVLKENLYKIFLNGINLGGFIIIGVGSALIIYAFLTVNGSLQNSFVVFIALITTLKILVSQTGVIINFFNRLLGINPISNLPGYSILIGLSLGFTLSISMAAIYGNAALAYMVGFGTILIGYILFNLSRKRIM
jgi:hypothetical protein